MSVKILAKCSVEKNEIHVKEMKKEGRKKQARSYKRQSKATQHTQGSHFSKEKYELPRVGIEPTTLYTLDRAFCTVHVYCSFYMYIYMYIPLFRFRLCCSAPSVLTFLNTSGASWEM